MAGITGLETRTLITAASYPSIPLALAPCSFLYTIGMVKKEGIKPDRWMQQLSWSLSRWETQDIKTQPKFNQYVGSL